MLPLPVVPTARRERNASRSARLTAWDNEALAPITAGRPKNDPNINYAWPAVWYRRGFPEAHWLTANDFMQHAGALFSRSPITKVQWCSHQPAESLEGYSWDGRYPDRRFQWRDFGPWAPAREFSMNNVPTEVFRLLPDGASLQGERHLMLYTTWAAANESLSRACVAFGRAARNRLWARAKESELAEVA